MTIDREELRRLCEASTQEKFTDEVWTARCRLSAVARTNVPALLDALEALEKVVGGVVIGIGSTRFMAPPDGGAPSLGEQVERMRLALEAAEAQLLDTTWQDHADHWQKRAVAAEAREKRLRLVLGRLAEVARTGVFDDRSRPFYADAMQQASAALTETAP